MGWIRELGNTGIMVSALGFGTVKIGRNTNVKYPQTFTLPTDAQVSSLIDLCVELNINLLDTAPAYGNSQERLACAIKGKRNNFVISSKTGEDFIDNVSSYDFSYKHTITTVENSLKTLHTDFIDIILVHSNGDDVHILKNTKVYEALQKLKQDGKIRAFGFSSKTTEGGIESLKMGGDISMVMYNSAYQHEASVLEYARTNNKGIIIKKALNSGYIKNTEAELGFIASNQAVGSIIVGSLNADHVYNNWQSVYNLVNTYN